MSRHHAVINNADTTHIIHCAATVRMNETLEYARASALGSARQAAWVLVGGDEPPSWPLADVATFEAPHDPAVMAAYWRASPELAS